MSIQVTYEEKKKYPVDSESIKDGIVFTGVVNGLAGLYLKSVGRVIILDDNVHSKGDHYTESQKVTNFQEVDIEIIVKAKRKK